MGLIQLDHWVRVTHTRFINPDGANMTFFIHLPTGEYTAHTEVGDGLARVILDAECTEPADVSIEPEEVQ